MNDFVVVANRLPVDLHYDNNGAPVWTPSPGGLVAALTPVLAQHHGCWIGWPGTTTEAPRTVSHRVGDSAQPGESFPVGL